MKSRVFIRRSLVPTIVLSATLFILSASTFGDEDTIVIDCACQTKKNPSWCETNIGDFAEHTYAVSGFRKPGKPLTAPELATFCQRHADATCQCDDVKYFKGSIRQ
jgi:hypothetical protein